MIEKCIDYVEQNGYYVNINEDLLNSIAFKVAEQLCYCFTDKDGGEVPHDVFDVVMGLIKGEL